MAEDEDPTIEMPMSYVGITVQYPMSNSYKGWADNVEVFKTTDGDKIIIYFSKKKVRRPVGAGRLSMTPEDARKLADALIRALNGEGLPD